MSPEPPTSRKRLGKESWRTASCRQRNFPLQGIWGLQAAKAVFFYYDFAIEGRFAHGFSLPFAVMLGSYGVDC